MNKDPRAARAVFLAGLGHFGGNEDFVREYAQFLLDANDANNAVLVLENCIALAGKERAEALWEFLLRIRGERDMDDDLAEGVTSRRIAGMVEWQEEARFVSSNEEREMLSGMMLRLQRYLTQGVALRGTYELV